MCRRISKFLSELLRHLATSNFEIEVVVKLLKKWNLSWLSRFLSEVWVKNREKILRESCKLFFVITVWQSILTDQQFFQLKCISAGSYVVRDWRRSWVMGGALRDDNCGVLRSTLPRWARSDSSNEAKKQFEVSKRTFTKFSWNGNWFLDIHYTEFMFLSVITQKREI